MEVNKMNEIIIYNMEAEPMKYCTFLVTNTNIYSKDGNLSIQSHNKDIND